MKRMMVSGIILVPLLTCALLLTFNIETTKEDPSASTPSSGSWPMFRHDPQHTGYAVDSAPSVLVSQWNCTTYGPGAVTSSPSVLNGTVYVGSDDYNLYAVDDGSVTWILSTAGKVHSSPAIAGGLVFVGSDDDVIRAVNKSDAMLEWSRNLGSPVYSSPCVVDNKVFVASAGKTPHIDHIPGKVYCLDMYNGNIIWEWEWPPPISGNWKTKIFSSPAVSNGMVYIGAYYYRHSTGSDTYLTRIYAINQTDGTTAWNYEIYYSYLYDAPYVFSSASIAGNRLFIGCDDYYLYCLKADTGDLLWKYPTSGEVQSSPAVGDNKVIFGSNDGKVYCLSQFGAELWNYTTGGAVRSSPAIADGKVFVGSDDGYLYVLDMNYGTLLNRFYIGYAIESSPAVDNGKVFVGSDGGDIHAFNGDVLQPEIVSVSWTPACPPPFVDSAIPREREPVNVEANVTDDQGVNKVLFFYRIDQGEWWNTSMNLSIATGLWTTIIPSQLGDVTVEFFLQAFDNVRNKSTSSTYDYTVKTLVSVDINGDGKVDALDLFELSKKYGEISP